MINRNIQWQSKNETNEVSLDFFFIQYYSSSWLVACWILFFSVVTERRVAKLRLEAMPLIQLASHYQAHSVHFFAVCILFFWVKGKHRQQSFTQSKVATEQLLPCIEQKREKGNTFSIPQYGAQRGAPWCLLECLIYNARCCTEVKSFLLK